MSPIGHERSRVRVTGCSTQAVWLGPVLCSICTCVRLLLLPPSFDDTTEEKGAPEDKKHVGKNGTQQGSLDNKNQIFLKGLNGDNHLHSIPESSIQQPADDLVVKTRVELLRGIAKNLGQRDQRKKIEEEGCERVPLEKVGHDAQRETQQKKTKGVQEDCAERVDVSCHRTLRLHRGCVHDHLSFVVFGCILDAKRFIVDGLPLQPGVPTHAQEVGIAATASVASCACLHHASKVALSLGTRIRQVSKKRCPP
mmetsp:Transcript_9197/g.25715  ORF Transcript_9197/g.25715 Transcript_9197/m.25715 type:complete len:253 (+) Transcript_9197:879-1637(+)